MKMEVMKMGQARIVLIRASPIFHFSESPSWTAALCRGKLTESVALLGVGTMVYSNTAPQLQAVMQCVGGPALLAVVDALTRTIEAFATASSGTPHTGLAR